MITISLCMIVRDEEEVLARCLRGAAGIADEIIILDTGSVDKTKDIAKEMGAKVYDYPWGDDFAAARNAAFDRAAMEYILWLDADDVIDDSNREMFLSLKAGLSPSVDLVMMRYHVAFDGAGNPAYTFYRERLLRRAMGYRWAGRVHEAITPRGNVIYSDIAIRHEKIKAGDPKRNLRIYERMLGEGETLEPRHRYYYARELMSNGRGEEAIALLRQCIADPHTWAENAIGACHDLAACLRRKGEDGEAVKALLTACTFGEPRAETCCDLGKLFMDRGDFRAAIFWYRNAPLCTPSEKGGGFALPECRGYIPYMQMCVCHSRLGEYEQAEICNEQAAAFKQGDESVLYNRAYFAALRGKGEPPPG